MVSRRLTWSLQREALGLLFGPVTFYDGQGFLVPRALRQDAARARQRAHLHRAGNVTEYNLNTYYQSRKPGFQKVVLRSLDQAEGELATGGCHALTADLSELGSVLSRMSKREAFEILPELISKEPLAPIVRQGDDQFFNVVRWTVFALIAAEELGITSANVAAKTASADLDVRRFLGVVPGNGRALGLDEAWAANVIQAVGNYGEIFERNVGKQSPVRLERAAQRAVDRRRPDVRAAAPAMIATPATPKKRSLRDRPLESSVCSTPGACIEWSIRSLAGGAPSPAAAAAAGAPSRSTLKFISTTPLFLRGAFGELHVLVAGHRHFEFQVGGVDGGAGELLDRFADVGAAIVAGPIVHEGEGHPAALLGDHEVRRLAHDAAGLLCP